MLTVLGLGGSPRKRGNTDLLLDRALAGAASAGAAAEKLVLNRLRVRPCQECGSCNTTGVCRVQDDMQGLYTKLEEADGIILASPIFFMGLSAQAKTIIDRCQALWARKHLLGRPIGRRGQRRLGLFIAVGGTDRSYTFRPSITTVRAFFSTLEVAYHGELLFGAVDAKGEILQRPSALEEAFQAGVGLVHALLAGEEGPPAPVPGPARALPSERGA